ncbi:MAG TPA: transporter [Tepidisphaeraceae bacterium]|nr:transporter [Tepidisphaeraceae bacterium]
MHRENERLGAGVVAACLSCAVAAAAQDSGAGAGLDKSRYTLFDPTPPALMREMETDRPDITESPHTVDAGHVQVESSFFEYTRDNADGNGGGGDSDAWSVLPTNIKIGLTNNMDLQLAFQPYVREEFEDTTDDGFGVTQLRLKINLWGNDGGDTALAIMPFAQFPIEDDDFGATDHLQGGVIVPLKLTLPDGWDLGLMGQLGAVRDAADEEYELQLLHTVALSRAIAGPLGGYVEYVGITDTEPGTGYLSVIGTGLTYGVNEDVQLDGGVNIGLSDDAADITLFAGISVRN